MTRFLKSIALVGCIGLVAATAPAQVIVGEHVVSHLESSHPYYKPGIAEPTLTRVDVVEYPGATYIAVHFGRFQLAPGDFVVVRSADDKERWVYTGEGRHNLGLTEDGFFATHIRRDMVLVELYTMGDEPGYGYSIDYYGRGYNDAEIQDFWDRGLGEIMNLPEPGGDHRSICTVDDTREAKCYQASEPDAYDTGRAVVRLLLNGSAWCTGWLIGCDGHVMTNEHCVGDQSQLNNIDFEFMAEGADCNTNCASSLACPGTIEASGGTLIQVDAPLDYALMVPDTSTATNTDLPATYGFMRLRSSGAVLDERIYIVQHPAGWGKRFAMESSYPDDVDGFAHVNSITEVACSGGPGDVGYWADTQGGSSGSPVLGYSDNLVIALHHCRGSAFCSSGNSGSDDPNRGVPIQAVIADLGANLPNCATCTPVPAPSGLAAADNGPNQVDLTWSAFRGGGSYNVYRSLGACPQTEFELIAADVAGTAYADSDVSGSVTYSYVVTVAEAGTDCESPFSNCADVTASGVCNLAPQFGGLVSAVNSGQQNCTIDLSWNAAALFCGSSISFNIYRARSAGFTPAAANLIASCVAGTSYADIDVESGLEYFYIVRAEDDSAVFDGLCGTGLEDGNTLELSAIPTGPNDVSFEDEMESGSGNWIAAAGPGDPGGTTPWVITNSASNSPSNSYFCSDEPSLKDQVVALAGSVALPNTPGIRLSFFHQVDTENNWDGGVLEYSTDNVNWFDILAGNGGGIPANANRFLANGYGGALNASANPLGGRAAWFGNSNGFVEVMVDLDDFAGSSVYLRWRLGCDGSVAANGWWVDDVRVFVPTACDFAVPPFSFEMWLNPGLYHSFYDADNDGIIDVRDILTYLDQNP